MVFVNRLSNNLANVKELYSWIPFMPSIEFTSDKIVEANRFDDYPDSKWQMLSPIISTHELAIPTSLKVRPPIPQEFVCDVFHLFWNLNGDILGVLICRGRGALIVLPKFHSNDAAIETFLHYVLPKIYDTETRIGLIEAFTSPDEAAFQRELEQLQAAEVELKNLLETSKIQLATATRKKSDLIRADETAKRVLVYYDEATKQPKVALFYLYKILNAIDNKFGSETAAMTTLGVRSEWKSVTKTANASYGDARHAPKPTDIIKPWTQNDIKKCFEDTEKVVMAYFATLFPKVESSQRTESQHG